MSLLAKSGLKDQPDKPHIELSLLSGSVGVFEYTRHCFPVLPQFHPKQLMELLNCGKVRWVKVILGHLVRYDILYNEDTVHQLPATLKLINWIENNNIPSRCLYFEWQQGNAWSWRWECEASIINYSWRGQAKELVSITDTFSEFPRPYTTEPAGASEFHSGNRRRAQSQLCRN